MPVTDELPPLAIEMLRTLRQTYDNRGPEAFDEDAAKMFHVLGYIIAQVSGRERLTAAMEKLKAGLAAEGVGEASDRAAASIH